MNDDYIFDPLPINIQCKHQTKLIQTKNEHQFEFNSDSAAIKGLDTVIITINSNWYANFSIFVKMQNKNMVMIQS